MALPTKLSASDVRNWARGKSKASAKQLAKGARKKGKQAAQAKDPTEDPDKSTQPVPKSGDSGQSSTVTVTVHHGKNDEGKPETEPEDPMSYGGPGAPELDEDTAEMLGDGDEDDQDDGPESEIEEKLGDFAEVLEGRADELEELAQGVDGDLTGDEVDTDTMREVQSVIPEDLRQDLVEHLSALSDDEISAFCQHLLEAGKIEDADLVAGFLKAAKGDTVGDDDDEDEGEDEEDSEDGDEEEGGEDDADDDSNDDDDDEEEDPPAKGKGKPPKKGAKFPPKGGKPAAKPPFAKGKN